MDDDKLNEIVEDLTSRGVFNGTYFCISCMVSQSKRLSSGIVLSEACRQRNPLERNIVGYVIDVLLDSISKCHV